jgi:PAS domain S-box-containing protein
MSSFQSDDETEMTIADNPERTTQAGAAVSRDQEFRSRQDLKRALQESRESEARLRKIVDTIPTLAWSNLADGTNEFVNERWLEYVGVFRKQAQAWSWRAATHPEDLQRVTDTWEELLRSGNPGEFEARLRRLRRSVSLVSLYGQTETEPSWRSSQLVWDRNGHRRPKERGVATCGRNAGTPDDHRRRESGGDFGLRVQFH